MLNWSYPEKNFILEDAKKNWALELIKGEGSGIVFHADGVYFEVDTADIGDIYFKEPKLFKKGVIGFFDKNDEVLVYVVEGVEIPLIIDVANKKAAKNIFYLMFKILQENGIEVIAG